MELIYSLIATLIVSSISFLGLLVLLKNIKSGDKIITAIVAFAAGSLLADALIHLLGEHIEQFGYENQTTLLIFTGVILMLLIEAYFHCSHDSREEIDHPHEHKNKSVLVRVNLIGDAFHNFLDGLAIAASFAVAPATGIATTIAVSLHEIPQELADAGVLKYAGLRRRKILIVNVLTALTAVLGAIIGVAISSVTENSEKYLVPLVVGQFIYIALADLLPEIHKKSGIFKYALEITAFCLGIGAMYLLLLVE